MNIHYHESTKTFHLQNGEISYIIAVLPNSEIGNLYFGKRIRDKEDFSYLLNFKSYPVTPATSLEEGSLSLNFIRREYPTYGASDFRYPALSILQDSGSSVSRFSYKAHRIMEGKPLLPGMPSTYCENDSEVLTLEITLNDDVSDTDLLMRYSLFRDYAAITRCSMIRQKGSRPITLQQAMSGSVDFPDADFEMIHLAGSWARERHVKQRTLEKGVQSIHSMRGASSAEHNPFMALKRPSADEFQGEAYGFSLIYSGNFLAQVEVDSHDTTRAMMGIHPQGFSWKLNRGESFYTPEMAMVYSDRGLNGMSQVFHRLYRNRLARGYWRDRNRPVLVNNWEATEMDFREDQILSMAEKAKRLGAELFVLDDGWFGDRDNDRAGLGDWYVKNFNKLPSGISGLAEKIEALGLSFGLWIEPEMVNEDSDLYRKHPDWIISTPARYESLSRNQYVLRLFQERGDRLYFHTAGFGFVLWENLLYKMGHEPLYYRMLLPRISCG